MISIRLLSQRDLEQVLTLDEVIKVVEEGFKRVGAQPDMLVGERVSPG